MDIKKGQGMTDTIMYNNILIAKLQQLCNYWKKKDKKKTPNRVFGVFLLVLECVISQFPIIQQ